MRWTVRDVAPPFDVLGYVDAPPPENLAGSGFRHAFPMSRYTNEHPLHFAVRTSESLRLEVGMYYPHGPHCECGTCPPRQAAFMSMGHPVLELRRIVGFHPVTVLRVRPASIRNAATPPH